MELEIGGKVYKFRFGVGFLKDIQSRYKEMAGSMTVQIPVGFKYVVASAMDGDTTALEDILLTANKTESPRLTAGKLEAYLEDESTDLEALTGQVVDFLSQANVCKSLMNQMMSQIQEQTEAQKRYEQLKKVRN